MCEWKGGGWINYLFVSNKFNLRIVAIELEMCIVWTKIISRFESISNARRMIQYVALCGKNKKTQFILNKIQRIHCGDRPDRRHSQYLPYWAGMTSGSRSSSKSSVVTLMSLLTLLLYCHRGLDFEYFCAAAWMRSRTKGAEREIALFG